MSLYTLIGLDLNATRARAAGGPAGRPPAPLGLDGAHAELPLALSLEGRTAEVGRAGLALSRRSPHLSCHSFLAALGTERRWAAGAIRLSADQALAAVLAQLHATCGRADALAVAVPAYLDPAQTDLVLHLARQVHLPIAAVLPSPLAAALAAHVTLPWQGDVIVADVDDHALTWSIVSGERADARLSAVLPLPRLGIRVWKERLLNAIAERFIRQSRRDPRDHAEAEQRLWDQLGPALEAAQHGRTVEPGIDLPNWYQNLVVRPDELASVCASLLRQALYGLQETLNYLPAAPGAILLTTAAAQLPGLAHAVEEIGHRLLAERNGHPEDGEDFGAGLLDEENAGRPLVHVLPPDAVAAAACDIAARCQRGEVGAGRLVAAPLPTLQPLEDGPPRLVLHGEEYLLRKRQAVLGCHPTCDVVVDGSVYPAVSPQHCEIVLDQRTCILRDRSHHGTSVNDRPVIDQVLLHAGDWICLGPPSGPRLRFLGTVPSPTTTPRLTVFGRRAAGLFD